ncbi:MAG: hypothetical protein V1817_00405 [Candidatus Micrarchaeota archaeon]
MEIAVDKKTIAVAAIAIVLVIGILVFFVFPQKPGPPQGNAASPTPTLEASVQASATPAAAAPKNLDPSSYKDSTSSFIVELANAIKKMVE